MTFGRAGAIALLLGLRAVAQEPPPEAEPSPAAVVPVPQEPPPAIPPAPAPATPAPSAATTPAVTQVPSRFETSARIQLSESMLSSYHLDNGNIAPRGSPLYDPTGSNYFDWLNKFQLDASWGDFIAQVRVDSALFLNAPVAAASDIRLTALLRNRYGSRLDFEKTFVTWTSRHLDVTLGDTYATFGRGLVLSLRKVDEFGIDTTVRGVSATTRLAGLTVTALGGWSNIVNVDPASGRTTENPNDGILGLHADYRFGKWVTPGFNVSHVIYAKSQVSSAPGQGSDTVTSVSGSLDFPHLFGFGALYGEVAAQRRLTSGSELWSTAVYVSGSFYVGRVTGLIEVKDYRNYSGIPTSIEPTEAPEFALSDFYTAAPTLERVQQIVLNNTDVSGAHARVSVKVNSAIVPFVSMAGFVDRIYQTQIYDPYAGVELRWNDGASRASASGGYRLNQYAEASVSPGKPFQREWHAELDVNQHLVGPYSVELSGLHVSHIDVKGVNQLFWHEGQVYLSLKRDLWSVALGYEYYTEAEKSIRPHYFNANASWKILPNLLVRLFVGGQRAGIKCVNGVCRNYPAFDGGRLEVVAKY